MKRVFIVEDEAVVALELKDHLQRLGYEVCGHAMRGDAALRDIPLARPDAILMDIRLANGISGLDVAEQLRGIVDVPVIFLTAYADAELTSRAVRAHSFAYLSKPYEPAALAANVELAIVRHAATAALRESEAFNVAVLDSLSAHVAVLDEQGVVVAVNKAWRQFAERNGAPHLAEHFIGADYLAVCSRGMFDDTTPAAALTGIRAVLAGEQPDFHLEYHCHSPDERRWFLMHVTPLSGPRRGAVVGHENITAIKQAEEAMRASEQRFRRLFNESLEGIYEVLLDGTILRVNPAFAALVGYDSPEDLTGTDLTRIYADPLERNRIQEAYAHTETIERVSATWRRRDGELIRVELSGRVVREDSGHAVGYHGIVRDVTAQRQYDEAMRVLSTGLSHLSGRAFYDTMAAQLAASVGANASFVTLLRPGNPPSIRTLGFAVDGKAVDPLDCPLTGSPSETVIAGTPVLIPSRVRQLYPADDSLSLLAAEGYAAAPFYDANGQVIGHVGVTTRIPIPHPRRVEMIVAAFALRAGARVERERAEERFSGVFEFAPDAILIVDTAGRIVAANRMADEVFGYDRDEWPHMTVDQLVPMPERHAHAQLRAGFIAHSEPRRMGATRSRLWALHKDGSQKPVEISLSPFQAAEGDLVVAAIRDVTDRIRMEDERQQLEGQLRHAQKMDSLGTLAGGIAHDFNNLLGVIVGSTEIARASTGPTGPVAESLGTIATASARAGELVNQILVFSRRQPMQPVVTSVYPIVEEVVTLLRVSAPTGIKVVSGMDGDVRNVVVDPTQIHQVVMNLGTNALHAIAPRAGTVSIHLDSVAVNADASQTHGIRAGTYVRISVHDDGRGMDAETVRRVFEPFFTTKGVGAGTGLGLAVAHGIVADHGGAITVESDPSTGSIFTVYLPATLDTPTIANPAVAASRFGAGRVAMIDDEELVLTVATHLLKGLGYTVTPFTRPGDAINAVRADPNRFDVIITDLSMPGMNGLAVARALVALNPDLPVVLTSGNLSHTQDELRSAGIRRFLAKPYTGASLNDAIYGVMYRG